MAEIIADWAGKERLFRLDLGGVMDLEQVRSAAIGTIYLRVTSGQFYVDDLRQTIRLALIGGGENKVEAKRLSTDHFDQIPYLESAAVAGDLQMALMTGVEDDAKSDPDGDPQPIRFSEISQICRTFHMSPHDLRALTYADFINMVTGFNAGERKAEPPTEEEFEEILAKYEPEALK